MKIAFDAKRALNNTSGLGNYARNLLGALMQYYPQETYRLYTPYAREEYLSALPDRFEVHFPETKFEKALAGWWRSKGVVRQLLKHHTTLYHGLSNEIPFGLPQSGLPAVVTIHDLIFLKHTAQYPLVDRTIYGLKTRYAARHAQAIVAVSEQTKADLQQFYGIAPQKIKVIYPLVDTCFTQPVSAAQIAEVQQLYGATAPYILQVGSFYARKNHLTLLQAFNQIKNQTPHNLLLVGSGGNTRPQVQHYIQQQGLGERVKVLAVGSNAHLAALYRGASLFVYPSLHEGFGMPVLEALYSQVPVIAAHDACLQEAGGAGTLYVDPRSPQELATAIVRVLTNAQLNQSMIAQGLQHAQTISAPKVAEQTMRLYQSVV